MISELKKFKASQLVLLAMLGLGLLCIVIALYLKLDALHKEEKIPIEQLIDQHWQQQLANSASRGGPENDGALLISGGDTSAVPFAEDAQVIQESEEAGDALEGAEDKAAEFAEGAINALKLGAEAEAARSAEEADKAEEAGMNSDSSDAGKIDINTATVQQLQQLKGIGPSKAEAIVADREKKGKFNRIEDIKRVKGIGEKLFAGIQESIVASP